MEFDNCRRRVVLVVGRGESGRDEVGFSSWRDVAWSRASTRYLPTANNALKDSSAA
jgi:hypothetical protein